VQASHLNEDEEEDENHEEHREQEDPKPMSATEPKSAAEPKSTTEPASKPKKIHKIPFTWLHDKFVKGPDRGDPTSKFAIIRRNPPGTTFDDLVHTGQISRELREKIDKELDMKNLEENRKEATAFVDALDVDSEMGEADADAEAVTDEDAADADAMKE